VHRWGGVRGEGGREGEKTEMKRERGDGVDRERGSEKEIGSVETEIEDRLLFFSILSGEGANKQKRFSNSTASLIAPLL
jgi:hypothetical protein